MKDELIMNNMLTLSKNMCEILIHACIEASNEKIKKVFKEVLLEYINLQGGIYTFMENNGWYTTTKVKSEKVNQAINKYDINLS